MHEVGLAFDIVTMAVELARTNGCREIVGIELDVGECCGVMPEALILGFESARKGTMAQDARLTVNRPPGVVRCAECGRERAAAGYAEPCPACGSARRTIVAGREFRLKSIDAR